MAVPTLGMTPRQQSAAAAVCLFVVMIVVLGLAWLMGALATGHLTGEQAPGRWLLLIMDNSALSVAGKSIPLILGIGSGFLAQSKIRDSIFFAIVALCLFGVLMALVSIVLLADPSIATEMFNNSPLESLATSEAYNAAVTRFFVPLTAWLVGTLAIQLGIKLTPGDDAPQVATPPPASPAPSPTPPSLPGNGDAE